MNEEVAMPKPVKFAHEAMKTTFHLRMPEGNAQRQRNVAKVCFEELDRLESLLSRFVEGSDVSQINHMQAGDSLFVSEECHACLLQALQLYQETGGLFDVTLGARIEHLKKGREGETPEILGNLTVAPDQPLIVCDAPGREIDLGGIGKGFALDRLQQILVDWEIESALISAGASTQLAHGRLAWPLDLSGDHNFVRIDLHREALSVSGVGVQGNHIVHPDADREPGDGLSYKRAWLTAPTAAEADAWSTAVMLMTDAQIAELGDDQPACLYVEDAEGVRQWGEEGPKG